MYLHYTVFQDSANIFGKLVEGIRQSTMDNRFQIDEIIKNVPGEYIYSTSEFNNGIDLIGSVQILQIANNDVVVTEYIAESSKYQQYNDSSGFFISTHLSPQEALMSQNLKDHNVQPPSDDKTVVFGVVYGQIYRRPDM